MGRRPMTALPPAPYTRFTGCQTKVEVTFTPEGPDRTRVELEHRGLDAYGDKAQQMRDMFDSPGAWQTTLEQYAQVALAEA